MSEEMNERQDSTEVEALDYENAYLEVDEISDEGGKAGGGEEVKLAEKVDGTEKVDGAEIAAKAEKVKKISFFETGLGKIKELFAEFYNKFFKADSKKGKILAGVLAAVLATLALLIFINSRNKINPKDYIDISYTGCNGYVSLDLKVDTTELYQKYSEKITDQDKLAALTEFCDSFKAVNDDSNLSNGQSTLVKIEYDKDAAQKAGVKLSDDSFKTKVKGVDNGQSIDVFSKVELSFGGVSPKAILEIKNNWDDDFLKTLTFECDKSDGIKNGDSVLVTCTTSRDELAKHGYITDNQMTKEVKADGLPVYCNTYTQLDMAEVETIKRACVQNVESEVADTTTRMIYQITGKNEYLRLVNEERTENTSVILTTFMVEKEQEAKGVNNYIEVLIGTDIVCGDVTERVYFNYEFTNLYLKADGTFVMEHDDYSHRYNCGTNADDLFLKNSVSRYDLYDYAYI